MRKLPVEVEKLKQAIRDEVKLEVERINDLEFFLRAAICKRLFHDFGACKGYFGLEEFAQDKMTTIISIANFAKFNDFTATISKLTKPQSLDKPELEKSLLLERFFFKKFRFIFGVDPLTLYRDQLAAGKSACHQQFVFYQSFLNVAVSVWLLHRLEHSFDEKVVIWLLHRLEHSFDEKVVMLTSETGCSFQTQIMESVVPGIDDDDEENDVHQSPATTPTKLDPSFTKSSLGDKTTTKLEMPFTNYNETPINLDPFPTKWTESETLLADETPISFDPSTTKSSSSNKPSTEPEPLLADKIPIKISEPSTTKSSFNNKPSANLEMLFTNDDGTHSSRSHPGSLQTPEGVTSFSNNDSQMVMQVPSRSGNVAAVTVANAGDNLQTQQARSSPDISSRATQRCEAAGVRESSSERHAHAQPQSKSSIFDLSVSRSINPNGGPYTARGTLLSESRKAARSAAALSFAAATVANAGDNLQTQQARSSPDISSRATQRSEDAGVRESSSERHAHAQPQSKSSIFDLPVSRSINPNGVPYAARSTLLSESRKAAAQRRLSGK